LVTIKTLSKISDEHLVHKILLYLFYNNGPIYIGIPSPPPG